MIYFQNTSIASIAWIFHGIVTLVSLFPQSKAVCLLLRKRAWQNMKLLTIRNEEGKEAMFSFLLVRFYIHCLDVFQLSGNSTIYVCKMWKYSEISEWWDESQNASWYISWLLCQVETLHTTGIVDSSRYFAPNLFHKTVVFSSKPMPAVALKSEIAFQFVNF